MVVLAEPDIDQVDLPAGWACTVMILNAHHTVTTAGSGVSGGGSRVWSCERVWLSMSRSVGRHGGAGWSGRAVMIGVPPRVWLGRNVYIRALGGSLLCGSGGGPQGIEFCLSRGEREGERERRTADSKPLRRGEGDEQHAQLLTGWWYGWVGGPWHRPTDGCVRVCLCHWDPTDG